MKRVLSFAVAASACVSFVACQPAAGLSDQDKAAIRKVVDDAAKIATAPKADYSAYVQLYYTEDATVLTSNMPPVQGRQALQAFFAAFPPMSAFKADIIDMDGRGDLAYVRGHYTLTMNPPGTPPMTDKGKYVEVWKKQADGSWKVKYDSFSSDVAASDLIVPTGAVAADASDELKKLGDIVGRWKFDGTWKAGPNAAAGPVDVLFQCEWFAGGKQVFYKYGGTMAGTPYEEVGVYTYDPKVKTYSYYGIVNDGTSALGVLTIKPGSWLHAAEFQMAGKPAKTRFIMSDMSPAGGTWKQEVSVAGGPWTVMGEGKYTKAK